MLNTVDTQFIPEAGVGRKGCFKIQGWGAKAVSRYSCACTGSQLIKVAAAHVGTLQGTQHALVGTLLERCGGDGVACCMFHAKAAHIAKLNRGQY